MKIKHSVTKGVNFILVDFYRSLNKIYLYGFFEKSNALKDKFTIGIWKIKYKTQK